jgi:hypothetical protein
MTTTHPTPAALLAECRAFLSSLHWQNWKATGNHAEAMGHATGNGMRVRVNQQGAGDFSQGGYSVTVTFAHYTGDGGCFHIEGREEAPTLREAYTAARDKYARARDAMMRLELPAVPMMPEEAAAARVAQDAKAAAFWAGDDDA